MKKVLVLLVICILLCGCQNNGMKSSGKIKCSDIETILSYKNNPKLIDVRTKEEYDQYHLDNAINIPYDNIKEDIKTLVDVSVDTPIIVYCKSGARSEKAYSTLRGAGYSHVYDLGSMSNCEKKN